MPDPRYWRIRMKLAYEEDLTREAWDRDEVGIWYGAWTAEDMYAVLNNEKDLQYLSKINHTHGLDWDVDKNALHTAKRFAGIDECDWAIVYFDGVLGLAHTCSKILSASDHPLNGNGEVFKYRKIKSKKSFSLNRLPDGFRILSFAGRGNIYEPRGSAGLARLLGEARSESEVTDVLKSKSLGEALMLLGPESWESLCQAYLILEHHFVPTGLATGRTLPNVDIVGRRSTDGARILAQCKKDPNPVCAPEEFLEAIADLGNGLAFFFAFGGCSEPAPGRVQVVDREVIRQWAQTKNGAQYFDWLFGA